MTNYSVWTKAKLRLKLSSLDRQITKLQDEHRWVSTVGLLLYYKPRSLPYIDEKLRNLDSVRLEVRLALKHYTGNRLGGEGHRSAPEA